MPDPNPPHEMYLGDGVYASFDGWHIVLDLRGQDSTTRIALEPAVLEALNAYAGFLSYTYSPDRKGDQ